MHIQHDGVPEIASVHVCTHAAPVPLVGSRSVVEVTPTADPFAIAQRTVAVVRHRFEVLCAESAEITGLPPHLTVLLFFYHFLEGLEEGRR